MMFLQFFIWGSWYTMVGQYLTKIGMGDSIGWVYTVGPIAAIISPLFLGMIADRYFSSQKVLAVLMFVGGIAMLFAPSIAQMCADNWAATKEAWEAQGLVPAEQVGDGFLFFPPIIGDHLPFVGILFLHMLCYMPTLGLTNTIAFRNILSGEKDFPVIRVFGTIGWIVAGFILGTLFKLDETPTTLYVTGGMCMALAAFAFTLPHTPPPAKGKKTSMGEMLGLGALPLLKDRSYAVFIFSSLLICIPLAAYYAIAQVYINHVGYKSAGGIMIWGQISEIIFMLLIPVFFARLGVKKMLAVGMLAWVIRYVLFSASADQGTAAIVFAGILLHGICYDFFFVTGFIYTDKIASKQISGQAQSFLVVVTQGVGLGLGAPIIQKIVTHFKADNHDELIAEGGALREESVKIAEESPDKAAELWDKSSEILLSASNWKAIWMYPAVFAAVILVLFFILFKDPKFDKEETNKD